MDSFFGHFKDLAEYKSLDNLKDVIKEVDRVIEEYNLHCYQWGLNKMTPEQYRGCLLVAEALYKPSVNWGTGQTNDVGHTMETYCSQTI
ncbi:IS3 family transposase [Cytobacillus firmus]|uniref:IS3 family transposase n=1 Tax=Cytobacillus firmus TaxID=1399 RepID=UPI0021616167|nr:IS3 family transposase [Cytobacillus firmus]MCS0674485.1 hypothetical protein [Cytobacillus firmus]